MTLSEIDKYFRGLMEIDELARIDVSMNGIQVGAGGGDSDSVEIKKAAFSVDACIESFERAAEAELICCLFITVCSGGVRFRLTALIIED